MNTETLRLSFMGLDIQINNPMGPVADGFDDWFLNRVNAEEVKRKYNSNQVSLNDDLDIFYNKVLVNESFDHEMKWIFHTELLSSEECDALHVKDELKAKEFYTHKIEKIEKIFFLTEQYLTKSRLAAARRLKNKAAKNLEKTIQISRRSEYLQYRGFRATFVFHPNSNFPSTTKIKEIYNQFSQKYLSIESILSQPN